jgi:hypothetical protein
MKKILLLAAAMIALSAHAQADTYVNIDHPKAVWDSTTGSLYALGIPGQGQNGLTIIPNAASAVTWTGTQNFTGTFEIGGTTETFPASGNLVGTTDTQTLTNKTLTAPTINNAVYTGPAPTACGATCTLTAANSGTTTLLNLAAGSIATLPAASGTGNVYSFVVSTTTTSAKDAVLAASSSDAIIGLAIGENAGTTKAFAGNASTYHSLQMPYTGTQPSGGFAGDSFTCKDIVTNVWECNGTYQAGTTPTTPYSAATS